MTTLLLWHLATTAVLLVAVTLLIVVQGLWARVRRALTGQRVITRQARADVPQPA